MLPGCPGRPIPWCRWTGSRRGRPCRTGCRRRYRSRDASTTPWRCICCAAGRPGSSPNSWPTAPTGWPSPCRRWRRTAAAACPTWSRRNTEPVYSNEQIWIDSNPIWAKSVKSISESNFRYSFVMFWDAEVLFTEIDRVLPSTYIHVVLDGFVNHGSVRAPSPADVLNRDANVLQGTASTGDLIQRHTTSTDKSFVHSHLK